MNISRHCDRAEGMEERALGSVNPEGIWIGEAVRLWAIGEKGEARDYG